jgi:hypothetical protein
MGVLYPLSMHLQNATSTLNRLTVRTQKVLACAGAQIASRVWGSSWQRSGHTPQVQLTPYSTSVPGVFAVGDVRANSVKRVTGSVGEGIGGGLTCPRTLSPPPWLEWRLKHAAVCIGPSMWRHNKAHCPQGIRGRSRQGSSFNGFLGLVQCALG